MAELQCCICKAPLRGFHDSRLYGREKAIACKDVEACVRRRDIRDPEVLELELYVANWNKQHPFGTRIVVTLRNGQKCNTFVSREAYIAGGVAFLDCLNGTFRLSHVEADPGAAEKL